MLDQICASLRYREAQTARREAYEKLNSACLLLSLRQLRERAAELESQYEPMATFSGEDEAIRERILQAVHYVITGRKEKPC